MVKSTFTKYLLAFISILLIGFIFLTAIFTVLIRTYTQDDRDRLLRQTTESLVLQIEEEGIEELSSYVYSGIPSHTVSALTRVAPDMEILILDPLGKVLLSTVGDGDAPAIFGDLGDLSPDEFVPFESDGVTYGTAEGTFDGLFKEKTRLYALPLSHESDLIGYVVAGHSITVETNMIRVIRRTSFTSCIWLTFAAIVIVYFMTERMVTRLRDMTKTTKSYAKGNFDERVTVSGDDEIAELGRSFNQMADALQNMEKMRNAFLANVSHDLRTPMTTIAGFIEGITSGAIPPEKQDYYLGVIASEVHRLSRLVSQILDISRLESGERKFEYADFDIAELARIILISFEQKIEDKHLDVEFDSPDSVYAFADRDAIHQVLYNLCHNAIKFAKDGGKFRIRIRSLDEGKIAVGVYDEGQSIPKEEQPFVFDRFYKTDKSRGLDKTGVGLGLYISKTIIDAHGEKIGVTSDEGSSEFAFTLKAGTKPRRQG